MGIFGLFRRVKNQQFDYKPRYFDADKEAREERLKRYKDLESPNYNLEHSKNRIRSGLKSRQGYGADASYRKKEVFKSNIRLLVIILVLALAAWIYLSSDSVDILVNKFLNK